MTITKDARAKRRELDGAFSRRVAEDRVSSDSAYACEEDFSNVPADTPLPEEVVSGMEPLSIIGATAES